MDSTEEASRNSYLVTGGAGFIGFHTALKLLRSNAGKVVVIDDFNSYYDVRLKIVSSA